MSTGRRTLRQNTRERLISTDWNRMETFIGADDNELMRGSMLRPVDDSLYAGTTFTVPGPASAAIDVDVVAAPLFGGVVDGLMVVVPMGAVHLLVTEGALAVIAPETPANPDDPVTKVVRDPGIQLITPQLTWTPNPGPGTRVDVVECQPVEIVQETDNRDIFNQTTGLFTPATVTKVTVGRLTYRIRLGAPAGGLPAPALGWLPLAVLSTPAGAPDLDTVGVWDVRDLLSDRAKVNANVSNVDPRSEEGNGWLMDESIGGDLRFSGQSREDWLGYRFGGQIIDGFGVPYVDLLDPTYWAAGHAFLPSLPFYVYALFPVGYVRWVSYYWAATPGAGGRTPGSYRGVLAVSHQPALIGVASLPIPPPTVTGLLGSTPIAIAIASSVTDTLAAPKGAAFDGEYTTLSAAGFVPWRSIAGAPFGPDLLFPLVPGTDFPLGARKLRAQLVLLFGPAGAAGDSNVVDVATTMWNPVGGTFYIRDVQRFVTTLVRGTAPIGLVFSKTVEFPAIGDGITQPAGSVDLRVNITNLGGSVPALPLISGTIYITGWD